MVFAGGDFAVGGGGEAKLCEESVGFAVGAELFDIFTKIAVDLDAASHGGALGLGEVEAVHQVIKKVIFFVGQLAIGEDQDADDAAEEDFVSGGHGVESLCVCGGVGVFCFLFRACCVVMVRACGGF